MSLRTVTHHRVLTSQMICDAFGASQWGATDDQVRVRTQVQFFELGLRSWCAGRE